MSKQLARIVNTLDVLATTVTIVHIKSAMRDLSTPFVSATSTVGQERELTNNKNDYGMELLFFRQWRSGNEVV